MIEHQPKLNRASRRLLTKELGTPDFVLACWHTINWRGGDKDKVTHHSHSHTFSFNSGNGGSATHFHNFNCPAISCGYGAGVHEHGDRTNDVASGIHTHAISGTTSIESATDLNHTHSIGIISGAKTEATHQHTVNGTGDYETCSDCDPDWHNHFRSGVSAVGGFGSHTHGVNGSTGTGTGTLQSHTHPIDFTGGVETHKHGRGTLTVEANTCALDSSHNHTGAVYVTAKSHYHSVLGDTNPGGEGGGSRGYIIG